ncbi:Rho GTPase activation protein [Sporodiniella umbellata]|nr:Rho GTPase activation protein [Sporodiniella umbellata]
MHQHYNSTTEKKKHRNAFNFFSKQKPAKETYLMDGIFGVPLCDAIKMGSTLWGLHVPDPVYLCFLEIYKRGLKTEGLFRLSGATSEVSELESLINACSNEERKLIDLSSYDIHTLASLSKKYLRDLPEPVIPNSFHEQFQSIDLEHDHVIHQLASIVTSLPLDNQQLIHVILIMAAQVQKYMDHNMMGPEAFATVFAPVCTGLEHSLKDIKISTSSTISTTSIGSTFKRQKKRAHALQQASDMIDQHIKRNKHWTDIWRMMIERNDFFIDILESNYPVTSNSTHEQAKTVDIASWSHRPHHYQSYSKGLFSPSSILVEEDEAFSLDDEDDQSVQGIPVAKPNVQPVEPSRLPKKTSFFHFPRQSTVRKIFMTSTIR